MVSAEADYVETAAAPMIASAANLRLFDM